MILCDFNQIMYSTLLSSLGKHTNTKLELPLLRHMVVNVLRANNAKFRNQYGEMILITDSRRYWRKEYFPYYKASRKKNREKSDIDWQTLYKCMDTIKTELQAWFPYKYICVEGTEADDVIATLVNIHFEKAGMLRTVPDPVLILSGDKDFQQLQTHKEVKQFDPVHKKWIKATDPQATLHEHILKGDMGDGIPNVASPDNCFVLGQRQKKMTSKLMQSLKNIHNEPENSYYRNYMRNKTLIDLSMIPSELKEKIRQEYLAKTANDRAKLMTYFMHNRMKQQMENISDF